MISEKFLRENGAMSRKEVDSFYRFLLDEGDTFEVELFSQLFTGIAQWTTDEDADKVFLDSYEKAFEKFRVRGSITTDQGAPFRMLHLAISGVKNGVEFFKALSFYYQAMVSQCQFESIAFQAENGGIQVDLL